MGIGTEVYMPERKIEWVRFGPKKEPLRREHSSSIEHPELEGDEGDDRGRWGRQWNDIHKSDLDEKCS